MAGDNSTRDDFKLKQKERARLARKATYAQQKLKMQERKAAQKADPEYKKAQQIKRAEHRQKYKDMKAKHKQRENALDDISQVEKVEERFLKDQEILSTLKRAKDIDPDTKLPNEKPDPALTDIWHEEREDSPLTHRRPKLRLVK